MSPRSSIRWCRRCATRCQTLAKPGVATENANAVIAKVQAFVDAAAKVTVGVAMNTASTIAKQISDAYQFANDALAPLNLPAGVLTVWKAAGVVLPSIEAMIG